MDALFQPFIRGLKEKRLGLVLMQFKQEGLQHRCFRAERR
jgi:hypothetical protein